MARFLYSAVSPKVHGAVWSLKFTVFTSAPSLGVEIVTLAPMTQTLEEIYLQVVKEDEQQKGDTDEHLS